MFFIFFFFFIFVILFSAIDIKIIENYISLCVELCMRDLCNSTLPIILLSDTFDMSTLDRCEQLFCYVESNVAIWKQQVFFVSCKNNLLRMCNGKWVVSLYPVQGVQKVRDTLKYLESWIPSNSLSRASKESKMNGRKIHFEFE